MVMMIYVPDDVPCALQLFTTGCVKLQHPSLGEMRASQWKQIGNVVRFGGDCERMFS